MIQDYQHMTSSQKAAALMLSLSPTAASSLFEHLESFEIQSLSKALSNLEAVAPQVIQRLHQDVMVYLKESHTTIQGGSQVAAAFLANALPESKKQNLAQEHIWQKLANMTPKVLADYLESEHPHMIALVVARLPKDKIPTLLELLPPKTAQVVLLHMLSLDAPPPPDVMNTLEEDLRKDLLSLEQKTSPTAMPQLVAHILDECSPELSESYWTYLHQSRPDKTEVVQSFRLSFEQLVHLDSKGVQALLQSASKTDLPLALSGEGTPVKDFLFSHLSQRMKTMMAEDIQAFEEAPQDDVQAARRRITNVAKTLLAEGKGALINTTTETKAEEAQT